MTGGSDSGGGFYEDDEPIEKIKAAFERGIKGITAQPRGRTENLSTGRGGRQKIQPNVTVGGATVLISTPFGWVPWTR